MQAGPTVETGETVVVTPPERAEEETAGQGWDRGAVSELRECWRHPTATGTRGKCTLQQNP
jgi:hypothetical protein